MKKSIVALTAIVLILLSGIAICSATQPYNESANASTASIVAATFYPTPTPTASTPTPTSTSTSKPATPTTSTSSGRLESVDNAQVGDMGSGMKAVVTGAMQIQILHNSVWTMSPITMYVGSETPLLISTDEYQGITTKETYPSGYLDSRYWGMYNKGSYMYRFLADTPGTHYLVAEGSVTGQSNVLTITVVGGPTPWPPWPTPTPTPWPPWPTPTPWPTPWPTPTPWPPCPPPSTPLSVTTWSPSYYYIGNPIYLSYTVNKPAYARVTYLKQNGNIVSCGPYYVAAGTHTDTGTIGYPRGMRTVVVDAWTSSGEYDYAVTSYNVG